MYKLLQKITKINYFVFTIDFLLRRVVELNNPFGTLEEKGGCSSTNKVLLVKNNNLKN